MSQTLGPDIRQTQGTDVRRTGSLEVSQTQGTDTSQTLGPDIRQTQGTDMSKTLGPDIRQTQGTDVRRTGSLEVSQTQGTDMSQTLGPDIRQTQGTDVRWIGSLEVSQTQGTDMSQTGGLEMNHTWNRLGTAVSLPTPSTGSVAFLLPTSPPSTAFPVRPTSTAADRETGRTVQGTSQQLPLGTRRAAGNTASLSTPPLGWKQIFIVEDQLPLVREGVTVKIPTKLILDMRFNLHLKDSKSDEYQKLAKDFALKISPFYDKIPGFLQLQIKRFSAGSVQIEFDAIFRLTKIQSFLLEPDRIFTVSGLRHVISGGFEIAGARVVTVYVTEKVIASCGEVLFCQNGFQCVHSKSGNVSCTSLCHTGYCKNSGICTHNRGQAPMCQCPVGSDYWFMGPRCDHRMTNQILIAIAFGVVFALLVVLAAVAFAVLRRFKVVLTEAKTDQTRSSYKRFSRFDDFSNQHRSQSWLSFSVNSLDNPGFSNSDELIHLQILDTSFYSCYEESVTGTYSSHRTGHHGQPAFRHSLQNLDVSINSINEYTGDSGKASDMSVCSWPGEPFRWPPFPILYQLGRERPFKARRPHSYYEGMELVSMERNWTA
ncbi:interphotoreceptor matrix proteoglycan 2 [Mobula hypostoma]|uniref:interphotoreceptor matrix proteoglycan 2 n=1 Tax=Mobula hypostoma TaxID=723540 RepID=UPI002FC33523